MKPTWTWTNTSKTALNLGSSIWASLLRTFSLSTSVHPLSNQQPRSTRSGSRSFSGSEEFNIQQMTTDLTVAARRALKEYWGQDPQRFGPVRSRLAGLRVKRRSKGVSEAAGVLGATRAAWAHHRGLGFFYNVSQGFRRFSVDSSIFKLSSTKL